MTARLDTSVHVQTTAIQGKFYIPKTAQSSRRFIVPDDAVEATAYRYSLAASGRRGIDPMCGVGTIPRVILNMGGNCEANEIDPHQYAVSKTELASNAILTLSDCTDEAFLVEREESYDYIYTSLPFLWFKDYPKSPNNAVGQALWRILKRGAMLIIDCDDVTTRNGVSWPLAKHEKDYFSKNGFRFIESVRYVIPATSPGGTDANFTEQVFTKGNA